MDAVGNWNCALNTQFPDHCVWMVSYTYSASVLLRTNFLTACKQCPKMSSKSCPHIGMSMSLVMVRNYWKYSQTVDSSLGHNCHSQWQWTLSKTWLLYLWQRLKDFIGKQARKWALELSNLHIHHHGRAQTYSMGSFRPPAFNKTNKFYMKNILFLKCQWGILVYPESRAEKWLCAEVPTASTSGAGSARFYLNNAMLWELKSNSPWSLLSSQSATLSLISPGVAWRKEVSKAKPAQFLCGVLEDARQRLSFNGDKRGLPMNTHMQTHTHKCLQHWKHACTHIPSKKGDTFFSH